MPLALLAASRQARGLRSTQVAASHQRGGWDSHPRLQGISLTSCLLLHPRRAASGPDAEGDPPAREIVRRDFHLHPVARNDADVVLAHLPADLRDHIASD